MSAHATERCGVPWAARTRARRKREVGPRSSALIVGLGIAFAAGLAPYTLAGTPPPTSPADVLMRIWPGIHDSTEQVIVATEHPRLPLSDSDASRVRTVIARVQVPWLGLRVLYLEEFLHDDPTRLRRQLLLKVEPDAPAGARVRVLLYTFKNPERWRQLNRRPHLLAALRPADIERTEGCDLVLRREGDQFRGGTSGLDCEAESPSGALYVDYQLVIGTDVYWYRRRLLRESDDALVEEVLGYDWFEPNNARLFTCRVQWSATGRLKDLRPLAHLDLHDQGGRGRFTTPDGRHFELSLHGEDWPFASDRDALILLLENPDSGAPIALSWAALEARRIGIDLGWMNVRCGALVPETDAVTS